MTTPSMELVLSLLRLYEAPRQKDSVEDDGPVSLGWSWVRQTGGMESVARYAHTILDRSRARKSIVSTGVQFA